MSVYSYYIFIYLHRASCHSSATLNEVFPCFFLSCKACARVQPHKDGARPALFQNFFVVLRILCFVSFSVLFVCKCVLYYCHRVATKLQLTNTSYHISYRIMSCHISYRISYISYHIIYHVIYHIICRVIYHIMSYHISYHIISYIIACHIIYHTIYHVILYIYHIMSCHISHIIYHVIYIYIIS